LVSTAGKPEKEFPWFPPRVYLKRNYLNFAGSRPEEEFFGFVAGIPEIEFS
jgi:hypothetical protein